MTSERPRPVEKIRIVRIHENHVRASRWLETDYDKVAILLATHCLILLTILPGRSTFDLSNGSKRTRASIPATPCTKLHLKIHKFYLFSNSHCVMYKIIGLLGFWFLSLLIVDS